MSIDAQGEPDVSLNVHTDAPLSRVALFLARISNEIDCRYAQTIELLAADLEDAGYPPAEVERHVSQYIRNIAIGREQILRDVIGVIEKIADEERHEH
jgi:hypothetical protein